MTDDITALKRQLTAAGLTHGPLHDALDELERTRAERDEYYKNWDDTLIIANKAAELLKKMDADRDRLAGELAEAEAVLEDRPADPNWFREIRDQCAAAGVPFLFKQWEGRSQKEIKAKGRALDGVVHDGYPEVRHG